MTRNYEGTDDAFIDGRLIHVAPRVAGLVLSLNVNDNQFVHAGDVVINIDPAPFQASYDAAKAMLAQEVANVQQSQADFVVEQADAEEARAAITVAEANENNAERDYERYQALPVAARSQHDVDNAAASYEATQAEVIEAKRRFAAAEAQVRASQTSISSAQAQLEAAKAQLQEQGLNLLYCNVRAGQDGYITRRTVEKGNYVQVGQEILDVVSPDVWVTANFKETQLVYIHPGEAATVTVDAYPQRQYKAHVDSVQTGTGAVFSVLPPENATGNFIKIVQRVPVKIVFDEKLDRVFAPGESVEPSVDISSGRH
jgi:membrane fusion protein (multidrug efflux system)